MAGVGGFKKEKAYEKYGWILLFAIAAIFLLSAITHIAGFGLQNVDLGTASPSLANFVRLEDRELGIDQAAFSALAMTLAGTSYRKGDRWAWYAMVTVPVFILTLPLNILSALNLLFSVPFLLVALLGLLLPYRKFFPKKQPVTP